jgi:nucleoid-associated protein YgaU
VTTSSFGCWENEVCFRRVRRNRFSIDREKIREFLKFIFRRRKSMAEEKTGGDAWDSTQWHVVKKGESLWKIAEQYYGDGNLYKKIFEANQDILSDPNLIKVGQKIRIP